MTVLSLFAYGCGSSDSKTADSSTTVESPTTIAGNKDCQQLEAIIAAGIGFDAPDPAGKQQNLAKLRDSLDKFAPEAPPAIAQPVADIKEYYSKVAEAVAEVDNEADFDSKMKAVDDTLLIDAKEPVEKWLKENCVG